MMEIRRERSEDEAAIRRLNDLAFGQDLEGRIVDALRANGAALLSLVALVDGAVAGHVFYSPATIGQTDGAALGPMSVLPSYQRQGIGSALVHAGNREIESAGYPFIIVLGHPEFYPRFGFVPASTRGISCEWDVPDPVFMLRVLDETTMQGVTGRATYRQEFSALS